MADKRRLPPFLNDPSALVIVDWSWWLNRAFRAKGSDGMASIVVGWLCALLSYHPAHVAIALDSQGPTFRHRMRHPTDADWRYKAGRDPRPPEFFDAAALCTELVELHSIPALWAEGYEADDVIATATRQASSAGYRVWICSSDKDLAGLVESRARDGIVIGLWDNSDGAICGPEQVTAKWGVEPRQMADLLAIMGDSGDNVPGVDGIGEERAASLLRSFDTLEGALSVAPDDPEALGQKIKEAERASKKAQDGERAAISEYRKGLLADRSRAKYHRVLHDAATIARFSRQLTALDFDAPIRVPWEDLPIGGFRAPELRARYRSLGFLRKEAEVPEFSKRAPWAIGYEEV